MSDGAHFHLSGFVNKQNFHYWSATNPLEPHERPLHSSKVTVCCAISSFGIIGPYFFEDEREKAVTVTGPRYIHMLENVLGPELAHHPVTEETFFQQDGATSQTAKDSMAAVRNFFPNHVISRYGDITRLARSPDLSACDFFLWGYEISCIQSSSIPHSSGVETSNSASSQTNSCEMLQRVMGEVRQRLTDCIERNCGHLSDVIFGK